MQPEGPDKEECNHVSLIMPGKISRIGLGEEKEATRTNRKRAFP